MAFVLWIYYHNENFVAFEGVLLDGLKVAIKVFRGPPQFLREQLSTKVRLASKLQSKDVEASGNNLYIIRVLGYYEHEFISVSREIRIIFLVEEYLPNGNMYSLIYGIF